MNSEEIFFNWQQEIPERFAIDSKARGTLIAPDQVHYGYLFRFGKAKDHIILLPSSH